MRRWFRFQIRKFVKKPKNLERAALIRRRLAFCYLFIAWNTLGILGYHYMKEQYPLTTNEKKIPALWYLRLIGENQTEIISVDGFKKASYMHFDAESDTLTPTSPEDLINTMYNANEVPQLDS